MLQLSITEGASLRGFSSHHSGISQKSKEVHSSFCFMGRKHLWIDIKIHALIFLLFFLSFINWFVSRYTHMKIQRSEKINRTPQYFLIKLLLFICIIELSTSFFGLFLLSALKNSNIQYTLLFVNVFTAKKKLQHRHTFVNAYTK